MNAAVKWGGIIGVIWAIVGVLLSLPTRTDPTAGGSSLALGCVSFLVGIAVYIAAGYLAGREAPSGPVMAGLIAGVIVGAISSVVSLILYFAFPVDIDKIIAQQSGGATVDRGFVQASILFGLIIGIVIALAFGAGLGALGGFLGGRQARGPRQELI